MHRDHEQYFSIQGVILDQSTRRNGLGDNDGTGVKSAFIEKKVESGQTKYNQNELHVHLILKKKKAESIKILSIQERQRLLSHS